VIQVGLGPSGVTTRLQPQDPSERNRAVAVAVAGVAESLCDDLVPGTVVVADRVLAADGNVVASLDSWAAIAAEFSARGLPVRVGAVASVAEWPADAAQQDALAAAGAVAIDRDTASLLDAPWDVPIAVTRVIAETIGAAPLFDQTVPLWVEPRLGDVGSVLEEWGRTVAARNVLLAGPRSFCAGVERAISTVERALDRFGAPVYVRRQIVHNRHVVEGLEERGAVFVQELDQVPTGSVAVLSAHGVSPRVRAQAEERDLQVIDATCPLVSKVHHEVQRFSDLGFQMVLIGHPGHDETEGTLGESDDISIVSEPGDVDQLQVRDPEKLAYITQTTLSPSDVSSVVSRLSERFPAIVGPRAADICYATQNRQDAVVAIASDCDLMVVVGSSNSSNAARLVEVSERTGCRAVLIDDERQLRLSWFDAVRTVGVTAAASSPPELVDRVVRALRGLGPTDVEQRITRTEHVTFPLPMEVR
jgi:4-hydroxy-3-methylbut-2-enyl diphosphate reductase